jgi:protein transport protein SEC31
LEIHELNLDDKSTAEVVQRTTLSAPSRFNRLAWSAHNSDSTDGVIIGGCEDGTLSFWNVADLLKTPDNESALIARCEAHHGAVRGLQVNPFQPFLVASGATDAEVRTLASAANY